MCMLFEKGKQASKKGGNKGERTESLVVASSSLSARHQQVACLPAQHTGGEKLSSYLAVLAPCPFSVPFSLPPCFPPAHHLWLPLAVRQKRGLLLAVPMKSLQPLECDITERKCQKEETLRKS